MTQLAEISTPVDPHPLTPRIKNPASLLPNVMDGIQKLLGAVQRGGMAPVTLELSHLRASQINGCSVCLEFGREHAKQLGESDERLFAIAAWRESPRFTPAERAALALTEAVTRLDDQSDPVPDAVWEEAARHYDERQLAALVLNIAVTNLFNRLNVSTRQVGRTW